MHSIAITVLLALIGSSAAQTCDPAGITLPCANGACPTGETCTGVGTAEESCCTDALVIPATVATIATTAASVTTAAVQTTIGGVVVTTTASTTTGNTSCVDLVNPTTGISDCPQRVSLCTDSQYATVMAVQCPKTCGLCTNSTSTDTSACADLVNPKTGTSDCASLSALCTDSVYLSVMQVQCKKTCGFCSNTTSTTNTTTTCVDMVNAATGVSDCPSRKALCTDPNYVTLMTTQCPLTCGFCSTTGTNATDTTVTGTATTASSSTTCADLVNAATGTSDCPNLRNLCTDPNYSTLMKTQCPLTCGFCSG